MPGEAPGPDPNPGGLVGRAAEAGALHRMLDGAQLVTVTGLPGVGKTAVSLEAARAAAGNYADGTLLVRLDTLQDEALLPHTIAAALRLDDRFDRSRLEVLVGQLRDRPMLLVLDTCEHLVGACAALVAAFLPRCPKVQILATSREPLRVPGESTVAIRPLRPADAVALFSQRAAQARIPVTAENRAAAASICLQLDHLPLAIELAVAELAAGQRATGQPLSASLAELLARLEAGYDFPGEPGGARHQSLRAAIGWSHELCTPAERLLWARLSVFTGPFRLRDAQDVCTTSELTDEAVATGLALLAERSVLLADTGADGRPRFLLPMTLRAYGRQMLRRLAQDEEFTERHRRWQNGRRGDHGVPAGK